MVKKELSLTILGASFPFSPLDSTKKFMSVIDSSLVRQQTHHVILILSLFLFLCLLLKRNEMKLNCNYK